MTVGTASFQELDGDQRRETVNTRQRFEMFLEARKRADGYRGSMVFSATKGTEYLLRSAYDPVSGRRRQTSLGPRNVENEAIKAAFEMGRAEAQDRLKAARQAVERQAGINRALGLGRVPELGARILRAVDAAGLLGHGLRLVGTHALYAYEAAAGIHLGADITTTDDIDLLFDARATLRFAADEGVGERTLLGLLRRVDRSFERSARSFQARNRDGYIVDLIRPLRDPPWSGESASLSGEAADLEAVEIAGLVWHENAPAFTAVAIDTRGFPLRIVAPDPRAFAMHKLWLSRQADRDPLKRHRDEAQARAVGALVAGYLTHLAFDPGDFRSFPREIASAAETLFRPAAGRGGQFTW